MADQCCAGKSGKTALNDPRWRRILWFALIINAAMFGVEIVAGVAADSRALQADALEFLGDSANYAISLGVAGMALAWRARKSTRLNSSHVCASRLPSSACKKHTTNE